MNQLAADLAKKARRVVIIQLLTTMVVAATYFLLSAGFVEGAGDAANNAEWEALSVIYGGLTSVILALISIGGFKRANEFALSDPKKSMMILYIGAVVRFAAVIVVLGIGLGLLKLEPMAVLIGFALAQISYLMSARDR